MDLCREGACFCVVGGPCCVLGILSGYDRVWGEERMTVHVNRRGAEDFYLQVTRFDVWLS